MNYGIEVLTFPFSYLHTILLGSNFNKYDINFTCGEENLLILCEILMLSVGEASSFWHPCQYLLIV